MFFIPGLNIRTTKLNSSSRTSTFQVSISPSHVYIRNVDILTSDTASAPSRTAIGTLTHIRIQAMQLTLNDVSFWYHDISPNEFTGLLDLTLPTKGIDVDLKRRSRGNYHEQAHSSRFEVCITSYEMCLIETSASLKKFFLSNTLSSTKPITSKT
jgi:hypothetical protein